MFYFNGKDKNEIKLQCKGCNNVLRYHNRDFHTITESYCVPNKEIECANCGNSTKKIIYSKNHEIGDNRVHCPKCNSTQIQLQKRGWKITTGFLGSGKDYRVCLNCLHKW